MKHLMLATTLVALSAPAFAASGNVSGHGNDADMHGHAAESAHADLAMVAPHSSDVPGDRNPNDWTSDRMQVEQDFRTIGTANDERPGDRS